MGSKYEKNIGLQISSQHPYAETFIGRPHVWTVDVSNKTDVREAVRAILRTEVVNKQNFTYTTYYDIKYLLILHVSATVALNTSTCGCFYR